jgi:predicted TIM-barrel fold metal-dependent hydrolase
MSQQLLHSLSVVQAYLRYLVSCLCRSSATILPPTQTYFDEPDYDFSDRIPKDAWDSHMHVTLPGYSLAKDAAYTPHVHTVKDAFTFEKTINISNVVLVQPSIYGSDNSCLLDALKAIGPRHARGVVCIDPDTVNLAELAIWHEMGVRGVRINLKSTNRRYTPEQLRILLRQYANIVRPLGWVLELFVAMDTVPVIESVVNELNIKICIAHCGAPKLPPFEKRTHPLDPHNLPGFDSLVRLAQNSRTWVKLSAAYRFDDDPEMKGIEAVAKELIRVAPNNKLVFASDWPHTRFEGMDVRPFVARCLDWTEAARLTKEVFCLNAKELWDVDS